MPSIPKLAPQVTLNLIDGDQYTIRVTLTNKATGLALDLTGFKAALQVKHKIDGTVLLTLATAAHPDHTNSTGCLITLGGVAGTVDLTFDLKQNAFTSGQFTQVDQGDGTTRPEGVYDLELTDTASLTRKYLRGAAPFYQEVTTP
jgi:hypothetical protein